MKNTAVVDPTFKAKTSPLIPAFDAKDINKLRAFFLAKVELQARHLWYDHTVKLAKKYKGFFTGKDQRETVLSLRINETDELKEQRYRVYNSFTPHIAGSISDTYGAVESTDEIVDMIKYENDKDKESDGKKEKLNKAQQEFFEGKDIKTYVKQNFRRILFHDPNTFIVCEFEFFDNDGIAYTYPLEVPSDQVFDYKYRKGVLQYLIVALPIFIIRKEKEVQGTRYIIYTPDHAMDLVEIGDAVPEGDKGEVLELEKLKASFSFHYFNHDAKQVNAHRVGFIPDPETNFVTMVSPLFKCDNLLLEVMIVKGEKDTARACHGFIQKYAYAERCDYDHKEPGKAFRRSCEGGYINSTEEKCPKCHGSGKKIHTTGQEVVYIKLPDGNEKIIPLRDYIHYAEIPDTFIKGYDDDLEKLVHWSKAAVFNSETFSKSDVQMTATTERIDLQWTYRALNVAATAMCSLKKFLTRQTANFNDLEKGLEQAYEMPSSYSMESMGSLIEEVGAANKAGLPYECTATLNHKIFTKLNMDNPVSVKRYEVKERHRLFKDKSEAMILVILADPATSPNDKVLFNYYEQIIDSIEAEEGPDVYGLSYSDFQKKLTEYTQKFVDARPAPVLPPNPLRGEQGDA